jgi:predicted aminopeptidase
MAFCLLAAGMNLSQSGCYLSRAAWEQARILSGRRPIADLIRDRTVPLPTRNKLQLVLDSRGFAADALILRARDSFTAFTQLDRDTLVLVVSAAHADRLRAYTWWFPIVGTVPYKGYFDFDAARGEARALAERGFDVYLRPADAYSTLGWFNDPLLSTTLARDSLELVKTVIHELTHNTFYAAGQAEFNESFASFVGSRGAAAFFRAKDLPELAVRVELRWEDEKLLGRFWGEVSARLDSAFAANPDDREARLAVKDTIYSATRQELIASVAPRLRTVHPSYAERVPLNNAWLLAQRVYGRDLDLFDQVWALEGHDLRRTIATVIRLGSDQGRPPFAAMREWVTARATPDSALRPATP